MEKHHLATPTEKLSSPASATIQEEVSKVSKAKRVNFADEVEHIVWVPSDPAAAWHNAFEYRAIKESMRPIVKAMRQNQRDFLKREDVCTRGLEHLQSSMHLEQQLINKDCVMEAVRREQERQRSEGVRDGIEIANASQIASRWARNQALQYGASDEAAVRLEVMRSDTSCLFEQTGSHFSSLSLEANGRSRSLPQQEQQLRRSNEQGLARQGEELRMWLDHEDSLRMTHLQAHNQSRTSLNSYSSDVKSSESRTMCTPLPDGTPPNMEQAFAA